MAAPAMQAIANITLNATVASVTFSNIPQNYRDLQIVISGSNNTGATYWSTLRLNGDAGSNYSRVTMFSWSPNPVSNTNAADVYMFMGFTGTGASQVTATIFDYSATDKHKTLIGRGTDPSTSTSAVAGRWASNTAVTSLTIGSEASSAYTAGTTFTLYGVLA